PRAGGGTALPGASCARARLEAATRCVLQAGVPPPVIFGQLDAMKFISCMTLFAQAGGPRSVFADALRTCGLEDRLTLEALSIETGGGGASGVAGIVRAGRSGGRLRVVSLHGVHRLVAKFRFVHPDRRRTCSFPTAAHVSRAAPPRSWPRRSGASASSRRTRAWPPRGLRRGRPRSGRAG